jgi:hypothetical protein
MFKHGLRTLLQNTSDTSSSISARWLNAFSFFSFQGSGETEFTCYVIHNVTYSTSPEWLMVMSVEQSVEWELAKGIEVLGENLSQRHYVYQKFHMTWRGLEQEPTQWERLNVSNNWRGDFKISCFFTSNTLLSFNLSWILSKDTNMKGRWTDGRTDRWIDIYIKM